MLEFVMEENRDELERIKLKLFRAYQSLCVKSKEAHEQYVKDMSEGEKEEFYQECAYETAPSEYYEALSDARSAVEGEFNVGIDWEEDVEITDYSEWFAVSLTTDVPDPTKKLKDMEFTVELSQKSEFLIALMEKVAEEHSEGE
ncbi:MAG: hypothetical protein ACTSPB_00450 [Candidatus Thorarchaeota archaeon]